MPLHIVIRSIESVFDVFDEQPPGTRTIKSLFYCREEIESQHAEWLRSRAGASDEGRVTSEEENAGLSAERVGAHIDGAIAALKANGTSGLREDLDRAVARLEELAPIKSSNFETIDKTLGDIERLLERAMLANWDAEHLKALKKEVAGQLRAYKAEMDADSYKNTFDLMLMKRLREDAGIPRLGLFYL